MNDRDHALRLIAEREKAAATDREAVRRFKLAADLGNADAQVELALYYHRGRGGLVKDDREAARLYKLAADQGDAVAQGNLGLFYYMGRGGLPKDENEAARLYKLSADQGHAWAQGNLAVLYEQGRGGLPREDREAARLYRLAVEQGDTLRRSNLGQFFAEGRGGLPKDDVEAARLFKLSADEGEATAQVNLGIFLECGRGGVRDDREAARLFKLAADQRDPRGQFKLGFFHANGRGGLPKNDHEAARLYKLAADQGHVFAQFNLGAFHERGRGGLPKDDREAARLYQLAADQGDASALFNLAAFYSGGRGGLPRDRNEAVRLYKLAADQELPEAKEALANEVREQQQEERDRLREAAERDRKRRSLLKEVFCRNLIEASMVEQGFLFLDEEGHLPNPKRLSDMKAAGVQAGITAGAMIALVAFSVLTGAGGIAKIPLFGRGDQNIDAIAHELAKYKSVSDCIGIQLKTGSVVLRLVINADDVSTQTIIHRLALIHKQSVTLRNYTDSFGRLGSLSQGILLFSAHSRAKEFSSSFAATCLWHDPHLHKSQPWVVDLEDQTVTTSAGLAQWKRWAPLDSEGMLQRLFQASRGKV